MRAEEWLRFGYLVAVLLVPLIPAYLLYKTLPSRTRVRGPFKGLSINLTGAFAGYFLLVLLCSRLAYLLLTPEKPSYEVWEVTGVLETPSDNTGIFVTNVPISLTVEPPNFTLDSSGSFTATVLVTPGNVVGRRRFPELHFAAQGYETVVRVVDDRNATTIERTKEAHFREAIALKLLPSSPTEPVWKRSK